MRIAYVCADPGVPIFGNKGCSIHVRAVIQTFLQQGHQVELFTNRLGGEPFPEFTSLKIHQLPKLPKGDLAQREEAALQSNEQLLSLLEQQEPFELVYERYSLWSFAGMEYAHKHNIPSVLEVNAPLIEEQKEHRGLINLAKAEEVARRTFGTAKIIAAVSQAVADYLHKYTEAQGKVHVVPNGVDPDRFDKISNNLHLNFSPDNFVIGFVGTMKPWHDLKTLVDAFALFYEQEPQARLLLIGDGPIKSQIQAQINQLGCTSAVHFTGAVTSAEIPPLLASMDVAVAPYPLATNSYFSPLKVYEYMAAGLAVIASEVGQLQELIDDGVNGLLCPQENPVVLAEKLQYLKANPEVRLRLGQTAHQQVVANHTWDAVVTRVLKLTGTHPQQGINMMEIGG